MLPEIQSRTLSGFRGGHMIERLARNRWDDIIPELMDNTVENYFNLLGLLSRKPIYRDIYIQKDRSGRTLSYLFHRLSGTIKFYSREDYDVDELIEFLATLNFRKLIGPFASTERLEGILGKGKPVTYLCRLDDPIELEASGNDDMWQLEADELEKVVEVYLEVFKSFASQEVMEEKLLTGRGRAFGLWQGGRLVSVVQTDFEQEGSALVVGVATRLNQQGMGYGTRLMKYVIGILQSEGRTIYLEYESPQAGGLYRKLGFTQFGTVMEYVKES
ncbi:MAG: GNAT family N-acetyltransferase [Gudongella sp.]|nr:GNAT family N-acetyltransferase [Gudongella sp.]